MRGTRTSLLPWVLMVLILSGCATPAPLSEAIIFKHPKNKDDDTMSYHGDISIIPAYNFFSKQVFQYGKQKYSASLIKKSGGNGIVYSNFQKIGLGLSDTFTYSNDGALSFSIGYAMLGIDFTNRIAGPYFFTSQISLFGGGQVIVQRPIFKMWNGGVTFGPYYRYDAYFMGYEEYISNNHSKRFQINSFGLRSSIQFYGMVGVYGYIESGYSPELKRVLVYTGLAFALSGIE